MSKPESAGESLESILASIRKSLSEQSTDALSTGVLEEPAAPYEAPGEPEVAALDQGLAARAPLAKPVPAAATEEPQAATEGLKVAAAEPQPETVGPAAEDRLQVTDEPPLPAPAPMPAAAASSRGAGAKDPLWFLSRPGDTSDKAGDQAARADAPPVATSSGKPPATEPKLLRVGVVRGPLPPFFGSSAEAAKAEAAPMPASPAGVSSGHGGPPPEPPATGRPSGLATFRSGEPEIAPQAPAAPAPNGGLNGKASAIFDHAPAADATPAAAEGAAQIQGLEAMVAELLRPMLRRWLDENMPRLVSAALKAEAELISKRDAKKP